MKHGTHDRGVVRRKPATEEGDQIKNQNTLFWNQLCLLLAGLVTEPLCLSFLVYKMEMPFPTQVLPVFSDEPQHSFLWALI